MAVKAFADLLSKGARLEVLGCGHQEVLEADNGCQQARAEGQHADGAAEDSCFRGARPPGPGACGPHSHDLDRHEEKDEQLVNKCEGIEAEAPGFAEWDLSDYSDHAQDQGASREGPGRPRAGERSPAFNHKGPEVDSVSGHA